MVVGAHDPVAHCNNNKHPQKLLFRQSQVCLVYLENYVPMYSTMLFFSKYAHLRTTFHLFSTAIHHFMTLPSVLSSSTDISSITAPVRKHYHQRFLAQNTHLVTMSTAAKEEGSAAMVMELWREASVQIDDRCRMIRLNIKTVDRLGHRGENYFVYHCRCASSYHPHNTTKTPNGIPLRLLHLLIQRI